jgi:hypothetical protein
MRKASNSVAGRGTFTSQELFEHTEMPWAHTTPLGSIIRAAAPPRGQTAAGTTFPHVCPNKPFAPAFTKRAIIP